MKQQQQKEKEVTEHRVWENEKLMLIVSEGR